MSIDTFVTLELAGLRHYCCDWFLNRVCDVDPMEVLDEICKLQNRTKFDYYYYLNELFNFKLWINDIHYHIRLDAINNLITKYIIEANDLNDVITSKHPNNGVFNSRIRIIQFTQIFAMYYEQNMIFEHLRTMITKEFAKSFVFYFKDAHIFQEPYERCKSHYPVSFDIITRVEEVLTQFIDSELCNILLTDMMNFNTEYYKKAIK